MTNDIITISRLRKDYGSADAKVSALRGVTMQVASGEFLMVTGRSGSGKSTLMHLMALLDEPTSGEIVIDGREVSSLKEKQKIILRLQYLGYIFQEYALIQDLTARENVMLPALMLGNFKQAKARATAVLRKVDLGKKMNRLPSELSGGEQQRVAIARSLVNEPRVIFADEPTANLDSMSSAKVLETFARLNREDRITIVMVTHEAEELSYASRVIDIKDGTIHEK